MRRVQGRSSRAVVTVALAGVSLVALASSASAAVTLYPDLKTGQIKQNDLMISKPQTKHAKLEITNEVANIGRGPLEIATGETSNNCDGDNVPDNDVDGTQMLYEDDGDGVFVRADDTTAVPSENPPLCLRQQANYYWQIWNLAHYTLTSIRTGEVARERDKIAYCTVDSSSLFPELDGFVPQPYYP